MTLHSPHLAERSDEDVLAHPGRRMSEDEFVAWCGEKPRAEWVDGEVLMMAPVSFEHSDLNAWLLSIARVYVRARQLGTLIGPEFFVRLVAQKRRRLPDILFVSAERQHLIRKQVVEGAPDLIFEIVSPDSVSRDWREKYHEYESAGVREYWVIDPAPQRVEAYALGPSGYARIQEAEGKLSSLAIPGFYLREAWLWQRPLPPEADVLRELGI
ncbi:MAG TPA: Uma2 family endonuclease [Tepidisphaeraceae bacterium]|nr:Uma2 family endonuclease [Tepidisphaeraceae bacterium]